MIDNCAPMDGLAVETSRESGELQRRFNHDISQFYVNIAPQIKY